MDKLEIELRTAERDLAKDEAARLRRIIDRARGLSSDTSASAEDRLRRIAEVLATA